MTLILVADDEPTLRKNLGRFFAGLGYEVETAADGNEAVAVIDARAPDLLITDINMPDMDGFEILNELRARGSRLPVICMSGGGQLDKQLLLGSASVLGALVTIEKPFELDDLRRAVERVVGPCESSGEE